MTRFARLYYPDSANGPGTASGKVKPPDAPRGIMQGTLAGRMTHLYFITRDCGLYLQDDAIIFYCRKRELKRRYFFRIMVSLSPRFSFCRAISETKSGE
jgi:hypothetical protein